MKLLMLTRYSIMGSSSRVRFFQYIPYLCSVGWTVEVDSLLSDAYLHQLYSNKKRNLGLVFTSYLRRIVQLLRNTSFDIIWIEKELWQWAPAWFENYILRNNQNRYILDYDDAIFHNYNRHRNSVVRMIYANKIKNIMGGSYCIFAGNEYIANYARAAGAKMVEIIPSVVDMNRYGKGALSEKNNRGVFTIGWIGSPSTSKYLKVIEEPLRLLSKSHPIELQVIGSADAQLSGFPVRYIDWSEETEVENIQHFDVGVMPLLNSPWECGKCGFKLIQYMACGKPVIASPVGVNKEIVDEDVNGYLAETSLDWFNALKRLCEDHDKAQKMGFRGRERVNQSYSLDATAPRIHEIFLRLIDLA